MIRLMQKLDKFDTNNQKNLSNIKIWQQYIVSKIEHCLV
jgi:hypothetical protein